MRKHAVRTIVLAAGLAAATALAPTAGAQELPPPALVLGDGRYAVRATFQAPGAPVSPAFPAPLTRDTGYFWFFDPDNVELVVKVLEACPVNQRVWVFAAGLTNVTVELTVEDRLAGVTWSRSHAGGPPFPPIQDTAAFATCDLQPLCGQGTAAEIAATPRADQEAELIALALGGGLTAPEPLFQRVSGDLAALRAADPTLATVRFIPHHDASSLILNVDDATEAAIVAGTYDAWDCSNGWYGATDARRLGPRSAIVEFAGRFDAERLAAEYSLLPGVGTAEPNVAGRGSEGPLLCAIAQGERIHYFAQRGFFDFTYSHWTTEPGGAPQPAGAWDPRTGDPQPPWFPLFEQCVALYVAPCCVLS